MTRTDLASTGATMRMIFGRRGFFGYAVRPAGETYWFSHFARRDEPAPDDQSSVTPDRWREQLLALHRDDPPEAARIPAAVSDAGAYAVYDLPSQPSWRRGRVCLIGDSAHAIGPHVGQGVSLALERRRRRRQVPPRPGGSCGAFVTFERLRRPRVEPIARQSRRTGRQKAPSGWAGRKLRDLILPMFLNRAADAAQRLYTYPLDWNEPISPAAA